MPDFGGSSLHCVSEAAYAVVLCDQFRAAVKVTAAFNPRDYCLVTQKYAQKYGPCVCACHKTRHTERKTKQEQPGCNDREKISG